MDRRTALKGTGILLGSSVIASASGLLMQSCMEKAKTTDLETIVLKKEDITTTADIITHLIPDSGIPEAVRTAIPLYIDGTLEKYSAIEQREEFEIGIKEFNANCTNSYGADFSKCTSEEQFNYLKDLESDFISSQGPTFYGTMKQWVFEAFFQTEFGVTQYLAYNPLPGTYNGCIPMEQIGKIQHSNDAFKL